MLIDKYNGFVVEMLFVLKIIDDFGYICGPDDKLKSVLGMEAVYQIANYLWHFVHKGSCRRGECW